MSSIEPQPLGVLDTRLPYRVGSSVLPVLPLETIGQRYVPGFFQILEDIVNILREEQVWWDWLDLTQRHHNGASPSPDTRTVLVVSDSMLPGQYSNWRRGAQRLGALFKDRGFDFVVEIIDKGAVHGRISSPITEEHQDVIKSWNGFRAELFKIIDGHNWKSVDVVFRKLARPDSTAVPTVIISAADADTPIWWEKTIPEVEAKLPARFEVELLFQEAVIFSATESENTEETEEMMPLKPWSYITEEAYEEKVLMGASVGSKGTDSCGTLGGLIRLKTPSSEVINAGITNYHVLFSDDGVHDGKTYPPEVDIMSRLQTSDESMSLSPQHNLSSQGLLSVMAPADNDHQKLLDNIQWDINELARATTKPMPQVHDMGPMHSAFQRNLDTLMRKRSTRARINGADRLLGTIYASSGWRTINNNRYDEKTIQKWSKVIDTSSEQILPPGHQHEKMMKELIGDETALQWCMDWSLIRVTPSRELLASVPEISSRVPLNAAGRCATRYVSIEPEQSYAVAKVGRTTGWKTGDVNALPSHLRLRYDTSTVVPVDLSHRFGKVVLSHAIVSRSQGDFIAPGDSGCTVLLTEQEFKGVYDWESCIVGLGFASNQASMISYMMPFDLVVQDIERVTGSKVIHPAYVGIAKGKPVNPDDL